MGKELKELLIGFENGEDISVLKNTIGDINIDGIHSVIRRIASNFIGQYMVANEITLEIFKEANHKYRPFGCLDESEILKRLTVNADITSVTVKYKDDTEDTFMVPYDEGENEGQLGAANINEDIYVSDVGNVYIVISNEKKKVDDYFNLAEINDKGKMSFRKDMMDIGIVEPEEKGISDDSLPDLYQYVYLNHKNNDQSLAVRVEDPDSGWKWIYEDKDDRGKLPMSWKYPNSKIDAFIKERNQDKWFDINILKQKYGMDSESINNESI